MTDIATGLEAFERQLAAQVDAAGLPKHENAIHHCLALGFQAAYDLEPGSIVFERPFSIGNCDLWLRPWDLALEVKYFRPLPSGSTRPMPQLFGMLLADFNKVSQMPTARRLVLLVTDPELNRYITRNNYGLLPLEPGCNSTIEATDLALLCTTARANACTKGDWSCLVTKLDWSSASAGGLTCYAWEVTPRG